VCGSTWPEDEEILLPAIKDWIEKKGRVVLAPHEVSTKHLETLKKLLQKSGLSFDVYSDSAAWKKPLLLVDEIGCLQELYSWGHVAFVGGSFKEKVHSVMEPLCTGIPVMVGPHHQNNREALQFQYVVLGPHFYAVNVVQNANDIGRVLSHIQNLRIPDAAILAKVSQSQGGSRRLLQWLQQFVN